MRASLLWLLLLLPGFFAGAQAATIDLGTASIDPGEPVVVSVRDLADGVQFTLLTEASYPVLPGDRLVFELSRFHMPFSLTGGEITTSAGNVRWVKFEAKLGNTTAALETSPEDGTFTRTEARNISPGTYEFIRLSALPLSPGTPVTTRVSFSGTKEGPDSADISFVPEGMDSGDLHIVIIVDEKRVFDETISIGGGMGANTTASADGMAALYGEGIPGAVFVADDPAGVPEGWTALSRSYRLVTGGDLAPGASLVLVVPPGTDPDDYTLFVASYQDGTWTMLPSRVLETGRGVVTDVSGPGTFALMAIEYPAPATPSPTRSTMLPGPVLCAAFGVFLIWHARKRYR